MTIRVHILDAGNAFGRRRGMIAAAIGRATRYVHERCALADVDLVVQPMDFGTRQAPIDAFTMGPHNIHVGLERSSLSDDELEPELVRTVVHELHHALRWRRVNRWTVGEAVVMEGLAILADQGVAGPAENLDRPMSDVHGALEYLRAHQGEPLQDHRRWLYTSEPDQPGAAERVYATGRHLMQASLRRLHESPWNAASRPGDELLAIGFRQLQWAAE